MKNRNIVFTTLLLALACFGLSSPKAFGVVPAPDGGYPGGNTAEGQNALLSLTTGQYNTGIGIFSALSLTDGNFCTGIGAGTLLANTADENTATGAGALLNNTTGEENTANGTFALVSNTEGNQNTAVGDNALFSNTEAGFNTATGHSALFSNTSGSSNTANGQSALFDNTTGDSNVAVGFIALSNNTGGSGNIALGAGAGFNVTSADNVICIGALGANVSNRCYIGHIRGATVGNGDGINVIVDSDGQLGTSNSSRRFKKDIKPMDQTSEAILTLKPVTFHYKNLDSKKAGNTPQFGLIAEDVAEVNPDLVVRDADGKPFTVRYDAVNAMLLNEFLKEHKKVEDLETTVAQQQKGMEVLTAQLKEQAAQIQKVSAQIEVSKPATKVTVNNP
jgi:trimeric autotransporter adhesin